MGNTTKTELKQYPSFLIPYLLIAYTQHHEVLVIALSRVVQSWVKITQGWLVQDLNSDLKAYKAFSFCLQADDWKL